MRRWLHRLIAVLTLSALAFAGRGYLYCHMAGQAMTACCCHGAAADTAPAPEQWRAPPCCEQRGSEAVVSDVSITPDPGHDALALPPAWQVAWMPPPTPRRGWRHHVARASERRAPTLARGPPDRRGKARARLGSMLC